MKELNKPDKWTVRTKRLVLISMKYFQFQKSYEERMSKWITKLEDYRRKKLEGEVMSWQWDECSWDNSQQTLQIRDFPVQLEWCHDDSSSDVMMTAPVMSWWQLQWCHDGDRSKL